VEVIVVTIERRPEAKSSLLFSILQVAPVDIGGEPATKILHKRI